MTRGVLFLGPTLAACDAQARLPEVAVLPPAARGDVHRAATNGAEVIGIVDGVFERVPSVWHKEVLFALERGVTVLGSSSMGALRAAELDVFGMEGVGRVYALVASGVLDDDDVAVAHASAEDGHRPLSTALVNIRVSLAAAVDAGVIDEALAAELVAAQKRRFYPDRTLAAVVADAESLRPGTGTPLAGWLDHHFVDQKRLDALALVDRFRGLLDRPVARGARVRMARTVFFEQMVREEAAIASGGPVDGWDHPVIEELQLCPEEYRAVEQRAFRRRSARELAMRSGLDLDQQLVDLTSDELRRELGLYEPDQLTDWLDRAGMTERDYASLVDRRARSAVGEAMVPRLAQEELLDELRVTGRWEELALRSRNKAAVLRESGWDEVGAGVDAADRERALRWWMTRHTGDALGIDREAFAASLGFADLAELSDAVLREFRFASAGGRAPAELDAERN